MTLLIIGLLLPGAIIGYGLLYVVARKQKSPADTSNRINKIRLIWFAATREELFTDVFPWLKNDEKENVN